MKTELVSMAAFAATLGAAFSAPIAACEALQSGALPALAMPEGRHRLNAERGQVWMLSAGGLFVRDARSKQWSAIHLPGWQWAGEPYARMPDVAIGPKGEAIVSSNVVPQVWRVDPDTLAVTVHTLELDADHDKDVGFSVLVHSPQHLGFFAVSPMHGSLWRIDLNLRRAQRIALPEPLRGVCGVSAGPGGVCVYGALGAWAVHIAPDQRRALVHAAGCSAP